MCDLGDDGEPYSAYRSYWRKARKDHKCMACQETIPPGHKYRYTSGVFEGEAFDQKHCARCWEMLLALQRAGMYVIEPALNCGNTWQDTFNEDPPEEVAKLAFLTANEAQALVKQDG